MSINDMKISELYKKLKFIFPSISPVKYPIMIPEYYEGAIYCIHFYLSYNVIIRFYRSMKCAIPYDIVKNFHLLNDFLIFHGFTQKIDEYDNIFFIKNNLVVVINSYEINLEIDKVKEHDDIYGGFNKIYENFNKIYDLIDYLKDYFNLQNKLAIRE